MGMTRVVLAAVVSITISTSAVAPPAQANPFGWLTHTAGSVVNRVVHGVVGGVIAGVGATLLAAGIFTLPLGIGIPAIAVGAALLPYGVTLTMNAIHNQDSPSLVSFYSPLFHPGGTSGPASQGGLVGTVVPGSNPSSAPAGSNLPRGTADKVKAQITQAAGQAGTTAGTAIGTGRIDGIGQAR